MSLPPLGGAGARHVSQLSGTPSTEQPKDLTQKGKWRTTTAATDNVAQSKLKAIREQVKQFEELQQSKEGKKLRKRAKKGEPSGRPRRLSIKAASALLLLARQQQPLPPLAQPGEGETNKGPQTPKSPP